MGCIMSVDLESPPPLGAAGERKTVSGKAFGIGFVVVALAVVGFILAFTPSLQDSARRQLGGELDRDVLELGTRGETRWVVAAEFTDGRTCVLGEVDGTARSEACVTPDLGLLGDVGVASLGDGSYLVTGITDLELPEVRIDLDSGERLVPRVYRVRGYPASFYYTIIDDTVAVERVVALDLDERELATRTCDGPLASAEGVGTACRTSSPALP